MIIVIAPFGSGEYYQKKINNDSSVHHSLKHLLLKTQESDSGVQNPIGEADFHGFCIDATVKVLNSYIRESEEKKCLHRVSDATLAVSYTHLDVYKRQV